MKVKELKSGIYKIVNKLNGKIYIGSAVNLSNRKSSHFSKLRKNKHFNNHLQNSFNKYGKDNFEFIILEECNVENLIEREQYYIDNFKPQYNKRIIAESNIGCKRTKKQIEASRQFMKNLKRDKEWNSNISKGLKEKGHKPTAEALRLSWEVTRKKVAQYSKEGVFLNKYDSIHSAARSLNLSFQNISSVCNGIRKSTGGFNFKFI